MVLLGTCAFLFHQSLSSEELDAVIGQTSVGSGTTPATRVGRIYSQKRNGEPFLAGNIQQSTPGRGMCAGKVKATILKGRIVILRIKRQGCPYLTQGLNTCNKLSFHSAILILELEAGNCATSS